MIFAKYTWLFPLKSKYDVFETFRVFKLQIENALSLKVKSFRSDGGGEFMSNQFQKFLAENGVLHQVSCPLTLEQNGCAERKHPHVVETTLTLLFNAHLPSKFWPDAFLTATYLVNKMPTKSLRVSPWKKMFGCSPNYSTLHVFGFACYPWLRPYTHHKLEPHSKQCIFLGYSLNFKGYKCLDLATERVYMSHHVIFYETRFPFQSSTLMHGASPPVSSPISSFDIFLSFPLHAWFQPGSSLPSSFLGPRPLQASRSSAPVATPSPPLDTVSGVSTVLVTVSHLPSHVIAASLPSPITTTHLPSVPSPCLPLPMQ